MAIPTVTIQIFLNTGITSRCMESTSSVGCLGLHSEALLILDDPAPGNQYGCPTNTCVNVGNGLGTAPAGSLTQTGAGTVSPGIAGANKNVFQGIQTAANSITFLGIPIDPPGTSGSRIIRITNVRGNANALGVASGNNAPTSITEQITATPFNFLPVSGLATQAVGSVQLGLDFSRSVFRHHDERLHICVSNSASASSVVRQSPGRGRSASCAIKSCSPLRLRSGPSTLAWPILPRPANQNDLTVGTFNTETGFQNSTLTLPFPSVANTAGAALVGDADWGTRLKAVFNNIPAGVRLYVEHRDLVRVRPGALTVAHMTAGESAAYAAVAGPITELTVSNGSATAVWEVLESDPNSFANLNFPVYVRYTASPATNSPALGTATVNGSYAPISTVTAASPPTFRALRTPPPPRTSSRLFLA